MRDLIYVLMVAVTFAFTSCESCKSDNGYKDEVQYSLVANGDAEGDLSVKYGNAEFISKGEAELTFKFSNIDTLQSENPVLLSRALTSNDTKLQDAAIRVNEGLEGIEITSVNGTYYLHLVGYAKEPVTGIIFSIDRTFTNKD